MTAVDRAPSQRWIFLACAIVTEVTGSLSLKGALEYPALYVLVACGFTSAFFFLALALKNGMPLGVAYGIWGAVGVALTASLSAVLYGEALTPMMLGGIALIIVGVLAIEFGSQRAAKREASA